MLSAMLVLMATLPEDPVLMVPVKVSDADARLIDVPASAELMVRAPVVVNVREFIEPTPV